MLGTYDFCGYYEWTFEWLTREGGHELLRQYWDEGISRDSQIHARELILNGGFDGMAKYWGHTLLEESPSEGFSLIRTSNVFRGDISDCPSKGFLIRNGLDQYEDYCNHCIGWIGPLMRDGGFTVDHEHNHCGQCWWEFRKELDPSGPSQPGELYAKDVRLLPEWKPADGKIDHYQRSTDPDDHT